MELPPGSESSADGTATPMTAERMSMLESIWGGSSSLFAVSKNELGSKITMPLYLRLVMKEAIESKDADAGLSYYDAMGVEEPPEAPEAPLVVFINSKSGGRRGPELKARLQIMMGEEQVCDLSDVKPHEFVQYGLGCLEKVADRGDVCAKEIREKLRVVVAGGDGTVGWILGCLGVLHREGRDPVPPTAIIPLGTGNDLSRSYGWGGSVPFKWKSAIKRTLFKATSFPVRGLDSWDLVVSMPTKIDLETPYALRQTKEVILDQVVKKD